MNIEAIKQYDFKKQPTKTKWFLRPLLKLLANSGVKKRKSRITIDDNIKDLKGPFLLLCNHNSFYDFFVLNKVLKKNLANYIVAIDGNVGFGRKNLLKWAGTIIKRKFTNDTLLVRQIKRSLDIGNVVVIYPEARYSLCGTTAILPESLGKMVKLFKVPVATLICKGHHLLNPYWDMKKYRKFDGLEANYSLLFNLDDIEKLSVDELNKKIVDRFQYDDFKWQQENNIELNDENRANGLHKVLYQCPNCNKEYQMESFGITLRCNACNKEWTLSKYGKLEAKDGKTEFPHIPDWYEWERENVRKEIENGTYSTGLLNCQVDGLPDSKFIDFGTGTFIHDMNGFKVCIKDKDGDIHTMEKTPKSTYSVHVEYNYFTKNKDVVDLNTLDQTWYCFPEGKFALTKIALACEELYLNELRKENKEVKKGLA